MTKIVYTQAGVERGAASMQLIEPPPYMQPCSPPQQEMQRIHLTERQSNSKLLIEVVARERKSNRRRQPFQGCLINNMQCPQ